MHWVYVDNASSPDDSSTLTPSVTSSSELSSLHQNVPEMKDSNSHNNSTRQLRSPPLSIFDYRSSTANSVWLLEHAYSIEELNVSFPPLCGEVECGEVAHALWASAHGETRQFCMDCQLRIMFGIDAETLVCDASRRKPYPHEMTNMKDRQRIAKYDSNPYNQKYFQEKKDGDGSSSVSIKTDDSDSVDYGEHASVHYGAANQSRSL